MCRRGNGSRHTHAACLLHTTLSEITQQDQNTSGLAQALLCLRDRLLLPPGISQLTGMVKTKRPKNSSNMTAAL